MAIKTINQVCSEKFGAGINAVNQVTALWVAEHILETTGKAVWKTIARHREKCGKGTQFPEFGTPLFATI